MRRKSHYERERQKLMASAWVDKQLRDEWERLEKEMGRAMTLAELKHHIGYINTMGRYVGPQKFSSECEWEKGE